MTKLASEAIRLRIDELSMSLADSRRMSFTLFFDVLKWALELVEAQEKTATERKPKVIQVIDSPATTILAGGMYYLLDNGEVWLWCSGEWSRCILPPPCTGPGLQSYIEAKLETQERTGFAERMPEPPKSDGWALLVCTDDGEYRAYTPIAGGWEDDMEEVSSQHLAGAGWDHWRLVRGPGVGGEA